MVLPCARSQPRHYIVVCQVMSSIANSYTTRIVNFKGLKSYGLGNIGIATVLWKDIFVHLASLLAEELLAI